MNHRNDTGNMVAAVLAADDRRLAALARDDADALAQLLDPAFHYIHANGFQDDRTQLTARIASGAVRHRAVWRGDVAVDVRGTTAVMHGSFGMEVWRLGADAPVVLNNLFLAVWVYTDAWRLLALSSTRRP